MPEQLLNLLKLCLLALLYLFFLRVARAVWVEVGGPRVRGRRAGARHGNAPAPDSSAVMGPGAATGPPAAPMPGAPVLPSRLTVPTAPSQSPVPTVTAGPMGPSPGAVQQPLLSPERSPAAGTGGTAGSGPELVTIAPHEFAGRRYPLTAELTIGRASGCQVLLEDSYVSQLHARVFLQPDGAYVEDLGSTNGTYLLRDRDHHQERHKVAGPRLLERGDQVQVGSTVMELVA